MHVLECTRGYCSLDHLLELMANVHYTDREEV